MKELDFVKISPSQNMTAFITSKVHPSEYGQVGNAIMAYESVHAEQAGFIVEPEDTNALLRLEMSGGEFCGNAVLAAAAYCVYKRWSTTKHFSLESSGSSIPLHCEVESKSPILYHAKGEMPQALATKKTVISYGTKELSGTLVQLGGITHFVSETWPARNDFLLIINALKEVVQDKAIGFIPYRTTGNLTYEIRPYIYVTESGQAFFERSCGSGTLALGIYLASQLEKNTFAVQQAGGTIYAEIGDTNYIATDVTITCEGVTYLP